MSQMTQKDVNPLLQRWCRAFRKELFNIRVSTTNGLERQHKELKENYLAHNMSKSLSSLVSSLVTEFLPQNYIRYKSMQLLSIFGRSNTSLLLSLVSFAFKQPQYPAITSSNFLTVTSPISVPSCVTSCCALSFSAGYRL